MKRIVESFLFLVYLFIFSLVSLARGAQHYYHVDVAVDLHNVASKTLSTGSQQSLFETFHELTTIPVEDMELLRTSVLATTKTSINSFLYDLTVDLRLTVLSNLFSEAITKNNAAVLRQYLQSVVDGAIKGGDDSKINQILRKNAIVWERHLLFGSVNRLLVKNSVKLTSQESSNLIQQSLFQPSRGAQISFEQSSFSPSELPTLSPTDYSSTPSVSPTFEPSFEPTWEPTHEPSREPSQEPTLQPSQEPTSHPTEKNNVVTFEAYFQLNNVSSTTFSAVDQQALLQTIVDVTDLFSTELTYLGLSDVNRRRQLTNSSHQMIVGVKFTVPIADFQEFNGNTTKIYLYLTGLVDAAVNEGVFTTLMRKDSSNLNANDLIWVEVIQVQYKNFKLEHSNTVPTAMPTLAPVTKTNSPAASPTALPTLSPTTTLNPTLPTISPTASPTVAPSTTPGAPTILPTTLAPSSGGGSGGTVITPTLAPTVTATASPSFAPTAQAMPIIKFKTWLHLRNSTSNSLSREAVEALLDAFADILQTTVENVKYLGFSSNLISSQSQIRPHSLRATAPKRVTSTLTTTDHYYEIVVNSQITLNLVDYPSDPYQKNATLFFLEQKQILEDAFSSGLLRADFIKYAAMISNATKNEIIPLNISQLLFSNVTIIDVANTQSTNPAASSSTATAVSGAIIAAIVTGSIIACGGILLLFYFVYTRILAPGGQKDGGPERDSDRIPIERMPSHDIPLDDIYNWDSEANRAPDDMIMIDVADDFDFQISPRNSLFRNQVLELSFVSTTESRL